MPVASKLARIAGMLPAAAGSALIAILAAGCSEQEVPVSNATTNSTSSTVSVREGTMLAIAASPDKSRIAISLQGMLFVLPVSGGTATALTDPAVDARNPAWSPDGRSIAFESNQDGAVHLWSVAAEGGPIRQLTGGVYDEKEPSWSADGARLAFSSDRGGQFEIWEMNVQTRAVTQVTRAKQADNVAPAYSPQGDEIVYVSRSAASTGVYVVDKAGEPRLIAEEKGFVGAPSWSPDGRHVLYSVITGSEASLMLDGRKMASGEDVFPVRAQWLSPTQFLYVADGKIKRRSLGASEFTVVEFVATLHVRVPDYERRKRSFDSTHPQPTLGIMRPALAPDAQQVAFAALGDLWLMRIGSQPRPLTADAFMERDPAWSSDGTQLLYSSDRGGSFDLWIRDLKSGRERRLTTLLGAEIRAAWSHDDRQIAFIHTADEPTDGEVWVVEVHGATARKLQDHSYGPGHPTWSANDKNILVAKLQGYVQGAGQFETGGTNQICMIPVDGGPAQLIVPFPHRSFGKRTADGPVISPDGRQMAFAMKDDSGGDALWIMPVDPSGAPSGEPGKTARQLVKDAAEYVSWSGDSRQILYSSIEQLKLFSIEDSKTVLVPVDLTWQQRIPAGRKVIHAGRLVDGIHDRSRADMDIVIEGNRIAAVEPHRADLHAGIVVDAADATVMPGLIDNHAHLMLNQFGTRFGRIYLAYGITSVRINGAWPYEMLEQRESIDSGRRRGPRVFGTGYIFEGPRVFHDPTVTVISDTQVATEIGRAVRLRYDWIKTYAHLPARTQEKVIAAAHGNGLPVTSHDLYPAAAYAVDGVEHLECCGDKTSLLGVAYDDVVQILARSQMALTPTFFAFPELARSDAAIYRDARWEQLMSPFWNVMETETGSGAASLEAAGARARRLRESALKIARGGALILAGTDSPYVITPYGITLHSELEQMVAGGFTPFEALRAASVNNARALGVEAGSIEAGKLADLVVVGGDPLANISNARKVQVVVANGDVIAMEELLKPSGQADSESSSLH